MEEGRKGTQVKAGPSAVLRPRNVANGQPSSGAGEVSSATCRKSSSAAKGAENQLVEQDARALNRVLVKKPVGLSPVKTTNASHNVKGNAAGAMTTETIRGGQLRVCAVTWNMNKRRFPRNLAPMVAPLFGVGEGDEDVAGVDATVGNKGGNSAGAERDGGMTDIPCDIFIVGVQEAPNMDGFVDAMLAALGGPGTFAHLQGVSLEPGGWIMMEVFVRRELLPMVTDVKRDAVSCGVGNFVGNKGGVGVSFNYAGARLCFLNAHLAAHNEKVKQRNADYHRIVKTMFAPKGKGNGGEGFLSVRKASMKRVKGNAVAPADPSESEDGSAWDASSSASSAEPMTPLDPGRPTPETPSMFGGLIKRHGWSAAEGFDLCVFMGDLNYRVEGNRQAVDVLMERGMMEVMHANDQLAIERSAGRAFAGWSEGKIAFPPTYKLERGSVDTYDTSGKRRVPSWTDRVMWRTKPASHGGKVLCESGADVYTSARGVRTSDHLPVVARIEATLANASRPRLKDGAPRKQSSLSRITLCSIM